MKMLSSLVDWSGQLNEIELLRPVNHQYNWKPWPPAQECMALGDDDVLLCGKTKCLAYVRF